MQSLKEEILELLEKDREFRLAVASLIGYKEILEKLEEHDRKFNEVIERLEELEKSHSEIQEINDRFVEQLEHALSEMEEVKEGLGENLKIQDKRF